jgi:hypothetical protein
MQIIKFTQWIFILLLVLLVGCAKNRFPDLVVAEEGMIWNCEYLDTLSETSDPGKFFHSSTKYSKYYDGELKVLERASNMGATHVVWLHNYSVGSSAEVYRCDE